MKEHHIRTLCQLSKKRNGKPRATVARSVRQELLKKTAGKCHVCGGPAGKSWQADHLVPHRHGGTTDSANLLPICRACNVLRRSFEPAVQRLIMQLGIYARREIRDQTRIGQEFVRLVLARLRSNRRRRVGFTRK